jgi:hypothetical protein
MREESFQAQKPREMTLMQPTQKNSVRERKLVLRFGAPAMLVSLNTVELAQRQVGKNHASFAVS